MTHQLKCESEYFQAVRTGIKYFEFRKNDRGFTVGDDLILIETRDGLPTGQELRGLEVTYILHGGKFGLPKGYCIMELIDVD
jgi:hypothetical protein